MTMSGFQDICVSFRHQGPDALGQLFDLSPEEEVECLPVDLLQSRQVEMIFAEWLLFRRCCQAALPDDWKKLCSVHPFGEGTPSLEELFRSQAAMAVFPLKGEGGRQPIAARLFLLPGSGNDNREKFSGNKDVLEGYRIYCSEESRFDGASWQLAASLARKALEANEKEAYANLACKWIVSGEVRHDDIGKIDIGNKLKLRTARKWILPEGNREGQDSGDQTIRWVGKVSAAWQWVEDNMVRKEPVLPALPADSLHCLVGGSIKPVLSCILALWPRMVHLYYSDKTKPVGDNVRSLLKELSAGIEVLIEKVPHDDMESLFDIFSKRIADDLQTSKNVFINCTGGNRLMGFAALLSADRHPGVQIIYRDADAKPFAMQIIQSQSNIYRNGICPLRQCPKELDDRLDWDKLFDLGPSKLPLTLEGILKQP